MEMNWRKGKRVAIAGAGPGGVSAALEFIAQAFDVRIFEKNPVSQPLGGAVLLSTPVLAIMRKHGVNVLSLGSKTVTKFAKNKGKIRADLPFNKDVETAFGIPGWHYGMLRSNAIAQLMSKLPEGMRSSSNSRTNQMLPLIFWSAQTTSNLRSRNRHLVTLGSFT